jgi:hypothetical protein
VVLWPYVFEPVQGVQVEQVDVISGFVVVIKVRVIGEVLVVLIALDLVKV